MDFTLSEEQRDIQKAAQEFAQGEFDADLALELDREGRFPEAIRKKACQLGFIGLGYPEKFGGQGLGQLETVLVIEEFCRRDSSIGCALSLIDFGSHIILKFDDINLRAAEKALRVVIEKKKPHIFGLQILVRPLGCIHSPAKIWERQAFCLFQ